jgi:hypothetical protein
MTLRPEDQKFREDESRKIRTDDDSSVILPDLDVPKPDPERDEQVKGGRMYLY